MKLGQVAIQLYTLRDFCKTAADFVATARKVKQHRLRCGADLGGRPDRGR